MLKITFVADKKKCPKIGYELLKYVHKNTEFHGAFELCIVGFEIVLTDCDLWSDASKVVRAFEDIISNPKTGAAILNLTFR